MALPLMPSLDYCWTSEDKRLHSLCRKPEEMATSFIDTFETASISVWSILLQVAVTINIDIVWAKIQKLKHFRKLKSVEI